MQERWMIDFLVILTALFVNNHHHHLLLLHTIQGQKQMKWKRKTCLPKRPNRSCLCSDYFTSQLDSSICFRRVAQVAMEHWRRILAVDGNQLLRRLGKGLYCCRGFCFARAGSSDQKSRHQLVGGPDHRQSCDHQARCKPCFVPQEEHDRSRLYEGRTAKAARYSCTLGDP